MAELDLEREIAGAGEFERAARTSSSCSGVLLPAVELRRWVIDDCVDLAKREKSFPALAKSSFRRSEGRAYLACVATTSRASSCFSARDIALRVQFSAFSKSLSPSANMATRMQIYEVCSGRNALARSSRLERNQPCSGTT